MKIESNFALQLNFASFNIWIPKMCGDNNNNNNNNKKNIILMPQFPLFFCILIKYSLQG